MLFKPRISLGMSYIHVIHVVSVTSTEFHTSSFKPRISPGMCYIHVIHVVSVTSTELDTCYACGLCDLD